MEGVKPLAKGTAFLGVFKYIKQRPDGKKFMEELPGLVSPDTSKVLSRKIISILEYPYGSFVEFLRLVDKKMGRGDFLLCREIGKFSAAIDMSTIYKTFQQKAHPEYLSRHSDLIWKSYYTNAGRMQTDDISPDHSIIRIYDFPQMDQAHCRLMEGWMHQAMVETGATWVEDIREVKCMSRKDPYHEFAGKWQAIAQENQG
jgi:hypothetical protein